jgi:hypothetical protein
VIYDYRKISGRRSFGAPLVPKGCGPSGPSGASRLWF